MIFVFIKNLLIDWCYIYFVLQIGGWMQITSYIFLKFIKKTFGFLNFQKYRNDAIFCLEFKQDAD